MESSDDLGYADVFYNGTDIKDEGSLEDIYELMRRDDAPEIYILTAILSLLFVIGTLGNIVVISVFSRSFIKHTSTYFILTLAVVDLVICTVVLPGVLIKNWSYPFKVDAVCKVWEFIRMSSIPVSALTLMAIGFDRFYLICMATEGPLSTSLAKMTISAIVLSGVSLGLPPTLGVGVYQEGDSPGEFEYLGLCMPNTLLISQQSLEEYWKIIVTLISAVFLFLIVTYTLIFLKVFKQNQKWNLMKKNKVHPVMDEALNYEKSNKSNPLANGWARVRRIARIIPARNEDGRIFFVRVRSNQAIPIPRPSLSNADSDIQGQGDSGLGSTENSRVSRTPSLNDTNKLTESSENMANRQEYTYGRQRKAHIKTAKVLCIVTAIYIISYSPPLLISAGLVPSHCMFLFYSYFIHSAANPIVYSFMNKKFRSEAWKLLHCQTKKRRW